MALTKPHITEYRRLLNADESLANFDAAIELLRKASGDRDIAAAEKPRGRSSAADRRLAGVVWALAEAPSRLKQASTDDPAAESFLMDVLLLIFHQAYFALLPRLAGDRSRTAEKKFPHAGETFAESLPRAADKFHVSGLIHAAAGRYEQALDDFLASLAATHSNDHEFLSRLQLVWTLLIERRRYREAFRLLREQYPRIARENLDEIGVLFQMTFDLGTRGPKRISA